MKIFLKVIIPLACIMVTCHKDKPVAPAELPVKSYRILVETLDKDLFIPWGLACLPNGDLLFSERNGKLNLLKKNANVHIMLATRQVNTNGEGGLLSIAIDPSFVTNHFIYTYETNGDNRVVRLKFENDILTEDQVILSGIPEAVNHDGGALKFGPDGYLYIGTGDALSPSKAQDKNSLSGKILRIDRDGNAALGNPFNNRVWSYGHRNVQGFAWTSTGTMLATEHGPSGEFGWCCHDEINLIQPGKNYGWPLAYGGMEQDSLTPSLVNSGEDTWAPSGCTWLGSSSVWPNCLVVACLRGEKLIRFHLNGQANAAVSASDTLKGQFNRLRNIIEAPDGSLLFCTSNIGTINPPIAEDDKIYRLYRK